MCFEVGPLSTWQNIFRVSKESLAMSQKVQPHGRGILLKYLMMWHGIFYKYSYLLI
jgi:hypothetical protein